MKAVMAMVWAAALVVGAASVAVANGNIVPGFWGGAPFSIDVAELSDTSPTVIIVSQSIQPGVLVRYENAAGSRSDPTTWSDVLYFTSNLDPEILFYSDQEGKPNNGFDTGVISLVQGGTVLFTSVLEDANGITNYVAGNATYYIHSDGPEAVPEASSLVLALLGAGPLVGTIRLCRRR